MFLGIDPSCTKTGVAVLDALGQQVHLSLVKPEEGLTGFSRVVDIRSQMEVIFKHYRPEMAVIEGYAYSNAHSLASLVEVGTALRLSMIEHRIPFLVAAPNQVKKFAGIKGKTKPQAAVLTEWGVAIKNSDIADAYVMARIALGRRHGRTLRGEHQFEVVMSCVAGFGLDQREAA